MLLPLIVWELVQSLVESMAKGPPRSHQSLQSSHFIINPQPVIRRAQANRTQRQTLGLWPLLLIIPKWFFKASLFEVSSLHHRYS